ncbi:MAG TPA: PspC domain-containing protein [Streptosporangiaceae bacterium]
MARTRPGSLWRPAGQNGRPAPAPWQAAGNGPPGGWQPPGDSGPGSWRPLGDPGLTGSGVPSRPGVPGGSGPPGGRPADGWRLRRQHGPLWARGPRDTGPLRRRPDERLAGGVAAGLAARTGLDVTVIRVLFVIVTVAGGFGLAAYVLAWLLLPAAGEDGNIAGRALTDRRGMTLAAGLGSVLVTLLVIASLLGVGWFDTVAWPLVISTIGIVLIWRNASPGEQETLRRLAEPLVVQGGADTRRRRLLWRAGIALIMLIWGLVLLIHASHPVLRPLSGVALLIGAIVLALGPWWLRIARDLVAERQARARAEERSDLAARVHDSVLQTLALIQLRAGEPQQVIQLARAQERELRSWLFEGRAPGSPAGDGMTLAAGVRLIQQEVEEQHRVPVDAVTVGDCELDDDLAALLAAAKEATVNAAKWSGAPVVSLFAEAEPGRVSVFVRDRGRGFDPQAVPADRKGLAESVRARMARRGGTATVRSAVGEGTEVSLTMPRAAGQRQPGRT